MDPVMKMWMFNSWVEDTNENVELFKQHGYLIGSFINPEAAKHLNGDNGYSTSEEDFDATTQMIRDDIEKEQKKAAKISPRRKRRRKKIS